MAELAALQRRFYDRVTGGATGGVTDEPGDGLIASGDLEIYARMYALRLRDALAEDCPKLRAALGDEPFTEIAAGYLRAHPPRSFTLRDLGSAFAGYLRTAERAPAWAADLAALERARVDVFDGPDARPLAYADVVALGDALPELVLSWVPSSVVVPLAWAVDDLWSAIEDDDDDDNDNDGDGEHEPLEPAPADRVVLVWRRDTRVLHRTLDADEAELAHAIAGRASFAAICEVLGGLHGDGASARATELLVRWLGDGALAAPAT
ncbi:MAG TPA: DNA-binding domain-containing protein [Kofleriaceae bacterium]|nr:DNA-binding domain-containing protein [Kofleriaceae bacterium]